LRCCCDGPGRMLRRAELARDGLVVKVCDAISQGTWHSMDSDHHLARFTQALIISGHQAGGILVLWPAKSICFHGNCWMCVHSPLVLRSRECYLSVWWQPSPTNRSTLQVLSRFRLLHPSNAPRDLQV
jgi:hypothetical protein